MFSQNAHLPLLKNAFTVIAHRGNHVHAPENTILAFSEAIRIGADYIEVDLRTTQDGKLVVMHDATVDRTTNGAGKVAGMSLKTFCDLQIRDERFPLLPALHPPSFEEVLRLAKGRINLYLDDKEADPEQVARLLREYQMDSSAVVYTSLERCPLWKAALPGIPTMISLPKSIRKGGELRKFLTTNSVDILDGPASHYTQELVKVAAGQNVWVWPDIQNPSEGPNQWKIPLEMGVRALQTDHPEALIQYLKSVGLR